MDAVIEAIKDNNKIQALKLIQALDDNVSLEQLGADGLAAIHHAAARGMTDVVRTLIDCGVNVDLPDARGNTPLRYAIHGGYLPDQGDGGV